MNKKILLAVLAVTLAFGIVLVGCSDPKAGGGSSFNSASDLPAFTGTFPATEGAAADFVEGAEEAISDAIIAAVDHAEGRSVLGARYAESGNHTFDGVTVNYNVNINESTGATIMKWVATIDGTYDGYRIIGKYNYDLNATSSLVRLTMDCCYTASKGGVGVKLVIKGTITATDSSSSGNILCTIYDNNNAVKYTYDLDLDDLY
jgi:hypothetical protein